MDSYPRILIGVLSPRDIKQFKVATDKINIDKYWVKYQKSWDSYNKIRNFYLNHKDDYDYLAMLPDDLIITQQDIDQLVKDIKTKNYPVITGVCNLDYSFNGRSYLNVSTQVLPSEARNARTYHWERARTRFVREAKILKVKFAGFPFTTIRTDVVEKISFRGDLPGYEGCCYDVMFCNDCTTNNIPIYSDFRVKMLHLKGMRSPEMNLLVGVNQPKEYIEYATIPVPVNA